MVTIEERKGTLVQKFLLQECWMIVLSQRIVSQRLGGSKENRAIKHSLVICNGFNTDYKSSEPLKTLVYPFTHSGYFYSAFSSPLLLRGAPNYSIDTVSKLTRRIATDNCK